ncbi:MAG: DUF3794 domain-containing protein, partial [Lachnospiraceae bacterium]|nr:DUF3794 domain-containing protein [Lachnospiraceae bacterium]
MELDRKYIYMSRPTGRAVVQVTMDEDRNVPDARPDVGRIILSRGTAELEEVHCAGEKGVLNGRLRTEILYGTDEEKESLMALSVLLPFTESLSLPGAGDRDTVTADWALEDLTVEIVHSRKLRIQAVLTVTVQAEALEREELISGVHCEEPVEKKLRDLPVTQIAVSRRETYRVREEVKLSGNKPNIREILWTDIRLCRCEARPEEGRVSLRGELAGFVLYQAEDIQMPVQWCEFSVPFEGDVEVEGCTSGMILDLRVQMSRCDWEVGEDGDEERRVLEMEALLGLTLKLYQESQEEVIADLYSPAREAVLTERETRLTQILVRNNASCRIDEKVDLSGEEKILQICYGAGEIFQDEMRPTEEGLSVEGALHISLLVMSADDLHPLRSVQRALPFRHLVEARGIESGCIFQVHPQLEDLNFLMLGGNEVEVRASMALDTMIHPPETV